jgi:hypothetical protein
MYRWFGGENAGNVQRGTFSPAGGMTGAGDTATLAK